MSAFSMLRTATRSSRLSRSLINGRAAPVSRSAVVARPRFYSSDAKPVESSSEAPKEGEAEPQTEEQKALAAKDAEIVDLTVRSNFTVELLVCPVIAKMR